MRNLQPTSYQWVKSKRFPTKISNKTRVSAFTTSIQNNIGNPSHINQKRKRNKRHTNWKGGSKIVIVCRWHGTINRKPYRLHQKTTEPNKWIWQNGGIQSQYLEVKNIFVHQQWNIGNRNQKKNLICYSKRKNKVSRNKPNQGGKRPVLRKLHNTEERN